MGPCTTRYTPVPTANFGNFDNYTKTIGNKYLASISQDHIERIVSHFGTDATEILDIAKHNTALNRPLGASRENLAAEVAFSARNEMVMHLDDFVFRRSGIGAVGNPGHEVLSACANIVGDELGWSATRQTHELDRTLAQFPIAISEPN